MKRVQPVYLKTYGKNGRKLSAWFSPEDRKHAFDSSETTDGSVFEPPKARRARVKQNALGRSRAMRPAKKKAVENLANTNSDDGDLSNEENIIPSSSPQLAQQPKKNRKKSSLRSQSAKRKAILCQMEMSSDEENIEESSTSPSQLSPHKKKSRKHQPVPVSRVSKRIKNKQVFVSSSSEGETSRKYPKKTVKSKTSSNCHSPSFSRFVTRRRNAPVIRPKPTKAESSLLNSSDDFASAALRPTRTLRSFRQARVPPVFTVSSVENSLNAAGTSSFVTNPLREISLNELTEQGLRLCSRKPILSSTPSASAFSKRRQSKFATGNNQATPPPSISVSCIRDLSPSQEDSVSPPHAEENMENKPESHHQEEQSADLFIHSIRKSPCSEGSKKENDVELPSVYLLSTDSGDTSQFLSATGGSEWLIEALKEKCLTEPCFVQLERLDFNRVSQLCGQTTFSSCLENSSSVLSQRSNDELKSVNGLQSSDPFSGNSIFLELSVTKNEISQYSQVESSLEHGGSEIDSQSSEVLALVDKKQSTKYSREEAQMERSASVHVVSTHQHTDDSFENAFDSQLAVSSLRKTAVTSKEALPFINDCLRRKCSVIIKKQLTGLAQQSDSPDTNKTVKNCTPDLKNQCFSESTELYSTSPAAETQSSEQDTEEAARLITILKEECQKDKSYVSIKRVPLSQLPKTLHLKTNTPKSSQVSHNSNEDSPSSKVDQKSQDSSSSEDNTTSDKEVEATLKRKKKSLATKEKKRRNTSTDRPGTARKACVSGMSVSRWKTKGSISKHGLMGRTGLHDGPKAAECSITELVPKQSQGFLGSTMNAFTPVRAGRHDLSALLADMEHHTPTWSRLKAALSVHRKVLLSAKRLTSGSPGREDLADISQDLFAVASQTPLSKHLKSQLLSNTSIAMSEDESLSDANKVYAECGQEQPLAWEECVLPSRMKRCVKIGEGTFGEVFSTKNASGETVALKIIPVEGSEKVNGEDQKTFGEILHEIIISKELSSLKDKEQNQTHGFIGLNDLHCVQGCYPPDFLNAWDAFDQRKGSENDRPDFFEKDQLFIILEFEFGGADLENSNGTLSSIIVAKSILHQVTAALAVAEEELHFEHRDLHWGNVLVKTTKQRKGSFLLNGETHSLETKGVLVRIIDYSLSRLEIDNLTVSCDISNDKELFMGQGDYQFEIYRLMQQENGNNWCDYHPHSNVLWLHYLSSKLLSMKYRSSRGRGIKDTQSELTRFHDNVLQYSSATEVLQNCPMFQ